MTPLLHRKGEECPRHSRLRMINPESGGGTSWFRWGDVTVISDMSLVILRGGEGLTPIVPFRPFLGLEDGDGSLLLHTDGWSTVVSESPIGSVGWGNLFISPSRHSLL